MQTNGPLGNVALKNVIVTLMKAPALNHQLISPKPNQQLISSELASAIRMNINRPLGDGRVDSGNTVVDQPTPGGSLADGAWKQAFGNIRLKLTGYGRDLNQPHARQLLAKDLYILARLMIDDDYLQDSAGASHVDW